MKFDPKTPILDYKGSPIPAGDGVEMTLAAALQTAIVNYQPEAPQKVSAFKIGLEVFKDEYDFTAEQLVLLKKIVESVIVVPLIVGRVFEILDSPVQ